MDEVKETSEGIINPSKKYQGGIFWELLLINHFKKLRLDWEGQFLKSYGLARVYYS